MSNDIPDNKQVYEEGHLVDETLPSPLQINVGEVDQDLCRIREYDATDWHSSISGNAVTCVSGINGNASSMALTGPLKGIDPYKINSLALLIDQLTKTLPTNQYGLPLYIYRPDLLDWQAIQASLLPTTPSAEGAHSRMSMPECMDMLDAATIMLSYDEGFPVTPRGIPLWQQLEFENSDAYSMFISYLELSGVRQLVDLIAYPLDVVQAFSRTYYWNIRVKAYDLFRTAHHQKMKLQRMMSTEDKHFQLAESLLRKLTDYFTMTVFDDENITPEKAVNMLEKIVKIQRVSAGMPANGESKENTDLRPTQPVQVIMQQISQSNGTTANTGAMDNIDILRSNPEALDAAQKLIIEMQGSGSK